MPTIEANIPDAARIQIECQCGRKTLISGKRFRTNSTCPHCKSSKTTWSLVRYREPKETHTRGPHQDKIYTVCLRKNSQLSCGTKSKQKDMGDFNTFEKALSTAIKDREAFLLKPDKRITIFLDHWCIQWLGREGVRFKCFHKGQILPASRKCLMY
jgi:hypothetical protein